jgi:L-asparaginase II
MGMPFAPLPAPGARPFIVEVKRGTQVESRHPVIATIVDGDGKTLAAWGDPQASIFPRSSNKAIQALPLVESGAAGAFSLSQSELAMACASHGGELRHTETAGAWLARIGLKPDDLECGAHWPYHEETARQIARDGRAPTPLHNNCSGKHCGMVSVATHLREDIRGYVLPDHPVQRRVTAAIEDVCGVKIAPEHFATDGCSMPTMAIPLHNLAWGFARFVTGTGLAPERAQAAKRLAAAVAAEPFFVAGTGRFCTAVMQAGKGRFIAKTGAEGVYTAASAELGLGIALKVLDGTARAAQTALGGLLEHLELLDVSGREQIRPLVEQPLNNWRGINVGSIGLEPPAF